MKHSFYRRAWGPVACSLVIFTQSCGSVESIGSSPERTEAVETSLTRDDNGPPTTSKDAAVSSLAIPLTTSGPPTSRPVTPTTISPTSAPLPPSGPADTLPQGVPFDPFSLPDIRGKLSSRGSPTGSICVVFENVVNASFNFGFASNGVVEEDDLSPRLKYLTTQLADAAGITNEVLQSKDLLPSLRPFAEAIAGGLQRAMSEIDSFAPDSDVPGSVNIDRVGAILAAELNIEHFEGSKSFSDAATRDQNCAVSS